MSDIAVYEDKPLTITELKDQVNLIQQVMKEVMREGEHFGVIPGCGDKPALLKSGAEKLIFTFRLVPDPIEEILELPNNHREYRYKIKMYTKNGIYLGAGVGSCSTMEGKYRFRKADLACPECGQAAIIRGKSEYGGGWLCYAKKGGCGKKWTDADSPFRNIVTDRIEHDNPADYYNTCQKMAKKRALVDACLTVTAASDIFTQDIEEMAADGLVGGQKAETKQKAQPQRKSEVPQDENPFAGKDDNLTVKDVKEQKGKAKDVKMPDGTIKEGKPYIKYIITTSDGIIYNTFSGTLSQRAMEAMKSGSIVTVKGKESQYGHDLEDIAIIEYEPAQAVAAWTKEACIDIITSSDNLDTLEANWNSLIPHIGRLSGSEKATCQATYDEVKKFIAEEKA